MATQDGTRIPLSVAAESDHRHFRLLELPPNLLALLTSSNPPTLQLKASEGTQDHEGGHTVLCTSDKTFNLRQKNSSNTVYLLEPRDSAKTELSQPALNAIAQCHSSLELIALRVDRYEAWKHMRAVIPCSRDDVRPGRTPKGVKQLFDQMPFHESLCHETYLDLGGFEDPDVGIVLRASPSEAYACWGDIISDAQIKSIKLDQPFHPEQIAFDEIASTQSALAFVRSFSDLSEATGLVTIQPESCASWVGRTVLEHKAVEQPIALKSFLDEWKDRLPESWRGLADVSKVAVYAQLVDEDRSIQFKEPSEGPATPAAGAAAGKKRKWHDKFRPQKK